MNSTLQEFINRTYGYPEILQFESTNDCNSRCVMCLDGETKILLFDFTWKSLKDIQVGEEIIGFKRGISYYNEQTKLVKTTVKAVMNRIADRIKLITDKGTVICTLTHKFTDVYHKSRYKEAQNFKVGQKIRFLSPVERIEFNKDYMLGYISGLVAGDGCFYKDGRRYNFQLAMKDVEAINRFQFFLKKFGIKVNLQRHKSGKHGKKGVYSNKYAILKRLRIQKIESVKKLEQLLLQQPNSFSFKKGFLAGFFDADGCLSKRGLHFINTNRVLIEKICEFLDSFKFFYTLSTRKRERENFKDCYVIRINGGNSENIRFFSLVNPSISRKRKFLLKAVRGSAIIKKKIFLGKGRVYNIETESGNYIANGMLSKNCPVWRVKRPKETLSWELFKKGIDDSVGERVCELHLHQNGEPMLIGAEELVKRVDYAKEKLPEAKVGFFTNGSLMDREATEKILHSKIDFIVFSFDGGDKESYEKVRRGLNFEEVYGNISYFAYRRKELGLTKPRIQIILVPIKGMNDNKSLNDYFTLFKGWGIEDIGAGGVINYGGAVETKPMRFPNQYSKGNRYLPCWRLFVNLIIASNGKACLCCQDYECAVELGDLRTQTIKEIWQGEARKRIVEKHIKGEQDALTLCKDCDYMEGFVAPDWYFDGVTSKEYSYRTN